MVRVPRHAGFTDTALVRLLARMGAGHVPEARQGFAERLSLWVGWTDAMSLSAALSAAPAAAQAEAPDASSDDDDLMQDCARLRAALRQAVVAEPVAPAEPLRRPPPVPPLPTAAPADVIDADYPTHRRRYLARQQAMEAGIAPLRERLRAALAARSPELAQLAAVDAVMERVLGVHERQWLATVPALLEEHFERLRQTAAGAPAAPAGDWLATFRRDMHEVLLAELDLRLQPVDGLLDALRGHEASAPT